MDLFVAGLHLSEAAFAQQQTCGRRLKPSSVSDHIRPSFFSLVKLLAFFPISTCNGNLSLGCPRDRAVSFGLFLEVLLDSLFILEILI
ncbi:hypothetical protein A0H81_03431 [Grifola frondosa]|uniref:Uncharacterized protein n=1 Tax=Grifola frondosa TaxID=5627 RepID=A0A1C7MHL1_GRIFR|nr:hypothetical protein A0H81_03431 [Grifola frondosa]